MKIYLLAFVLFIYINITSAQSNTGNIALLIGNSLYSESPVKNSANDAILLAETLRKKGFEIMLCTNLDVREMKIKMQEFETKLHQSNGIGLFFYSGYGLQFNGENYLLPLNSQIEKEQDIELEAINLQRLIGEMEIAQTSLNMIILDASRECPFAKNLKIKNSGLAIIEPPLGTLVAYSTIPGTYSVSSNTFNSLYVKELTTALEKPNLKIEEIFKRVRRKVYKKTHGKQATWENSSLFKDFYF